jgi:hypothetical protein
MHLGTRAANFHQLRDTTPRSAAILRTPEPPTSFKSLDDPPRFGNRQLEEGLPTQMLDEASREHRLARAIASPEAQELLEGAAQASRLSHPEALKELREVLQAEVSHLLLDITRNLKRTSTAQMTTILENRLKARSAQEIKAGSPQIVFEVTSGKLVFQKSYRIGGLEVRAGDINAYKLISIAVAGIACIRTECVEQLEDLLLEEASDSRRPALRGVTITDPALSWDDLNRWRSRADPEDLWVRLRPAPAL